MMGSWMGSHFTNDDLVKESRIVDDYDFEISFEGEREGVEVWEFQLTPRPEAPVVWGRIEEQVRKADLMPTWIRYYDEDGDLVRTLTFSGYRTMGGRLVPACGADIVIRWRQGSGPRLARTRPPRVAGNLWLYNSSRGVLVAPGPARKLRRSLRPYGA